MIWFMGTDRPLGKKKIRDCFLGNTNPMVSVGVVKYDIVLSKKSIIPHFTLVASVASVAMLITD
jgi:hypothetical protein